MVRILYESQEPFGEIKKFLHAITLYKLFRALSVITLVLAIPLTVFIAQQQQELRQRASGLPVTPATPPFPTGSGRAKLSIRPQTTQMNVGQTKTFDIVLEPEKHSISFVKVLLAYTNSHLATKSASLTNNKSCNTPICINQKAFPVVFKQPAYTSGFISFEVGIGADPKKTIRKRTTVATLTLEAQPIFGINQATIEFVTDNNQTQLLSISPNDSPNQNILKSAQEATVKINVPKKNKQNTTLSPTPIR